MRDVALRLEQLENNLYKEMSPEDDTPLYIQVWQANTLIYGAARMPATLPPAAEVGRAGTLPLPGHWISWIETDTGTGITVRVAQELDMAWWLSIPKIGFLFLPLLFSFPFLLLPAWLIVRVGLRPLRAIVGEIEARSASELSPLQASPYKELSPLVTAINHLMARLTERLQREKEFLADAAHELKTPLSIIQINADSLVEARDARRIQESRYGLSHGVARATHAVHQLLALARSSVDRDEMALQQMDLVELVRDRLALAVQLALRRGIDISLQAPEQCLLPLHRESVALLIDNLVDNAVKYSPEEGGIEVRISAVAHAVQLYIVDQGPGIPVAMRSRVFERFFRLPGQEQPGSGLGLAIAEGAAERNHAHITLDEGRGGVGLTVCVVFHPPGSARIA